MTSMDSPLGRADDFVREDGLLICGVCGQPKEMYLETPFFPEPRKVSVLCQCENDRINRQQEREKAEHHRDYIERLRKDGISKAMYHDCRFAMCDDQECEAFRKAKHSQTGLRTRSESATV